MTDQGNQAELLEALNSITAELKRINQTLAGLASQQASRPSAPPAAGRGPISRGPSSFRGTAGPRGAKPAYGRPRKEGFGATEVEEGGEREFSPRTPGRKPAPRTGGRKPAPKSPMSFKKKDGYPKRPKP